MERRMSNRPKGKHVRINTENPDALGICDYTGFVFNRKDLVRQMEWRGNALVWTGFMVGRPYADKPNPQLIPPILPPDPVPVEQPRPPYQQLNEWSNNALGLWQNIEFTWASLWNLEDGIQTLNYAQVLQQLNTTYWGAG
jgi:hypothetical protein